MYRTQPIQNTAARFGQRARLECEIQSHPPLTSLKWYRNQMEVVQQPGQVILAAEEPDPKEQPQVVRASLTIERSTSADAGKYTVTALNPFGQKSCYSFLHVDDQRILFFFS